jgi:hypothetical protein
VNHAETEDIPRFGHRALPAWWRRFDPCGLSVIAAAGLMLAVVVAAGAWGTAQGSHVRIRHEVVTIVSQTPVDRTVTIHPPPVTIPQPVAGPPVTRTVTRTVTVPGPVVTVTAFPAPAPTVTVTVTATPAAAATP